MERRRQKLQQKMAARLLASSLGLAGISQSGSGADEVVSRQALATPPSSAILEARGLTLDMEEMVVTKDDEPVSLTPTEFRLLVTLMKRPNHPHTFQELAQVTHGQQTDAAEARDLLKSPMGRLRRKLGQAVDGKAYITNVRGVGYKFVSEEE
jgi:DNA-binding response OmpR family regulator